jgi:hypothetical protein
VEVDAVAETAPAAADNALLAAALGSDLSDGTLSLPLLALATVPPAVPQVCCLFDLIFVHLLYFSSPPEQNNKRVSYITYVV